MGIFGNRDPLGISGMGSFAAPDIGNALPQDPRVAQSLKPGFFGKGGGWKNVLGLISDGILAAENQAPIYSPAVARKHEEERARAQSLQDYQMQRQDKNADWQSQQQWKIDHPDPVQPGEQERLIQQWASLPDNDPRKPLVERAVRGFQYTAPVMEAKQQNAIDLADHRLGNSLTLRSAPTYAATHPKTGGGGRGLTPTARAKYIADAQAAISRGADPAKVHARLQQIGVE
jgi:hypothetical protein